MKPIIRYAIAALAICSILCVMACPKKDAVRQAAKASYRLPAATNDLIDRIKVGVDRGIFTPAEARRLGAILEPIAIAEGTFVDVVRVLEKHYRETGTVDPAQLRIVQDKYSELVTLFLDLLQTIGVLEPDDRLFIESAIAAVRVFLRTIGIGIKSPAVDKLATTIVTPDPPLPAGPKQRKRKKGNQTSAGLFGSVPSFASNPQLRFA